MSKFDVAKDFGRFLLKKKKYWLIPIIIVLLILGLIIVLGEGSVFAPLVYPF